MQVIKLFSPWHTRDLVYGNVCFSPGVQLREADGALWEYWPDESIFGYHRPKAWYSWEPRWHSGYRSDLARRVKHSLDESEWLHYAHPKSEYRVPHITNCGLTTCLTNTNRVQQAVAIVSNSGGPIWFLRQGLRFRNRFVTHALVQLYGRRCGWEHFRKRGPLSRPAVPSNYCGELNWKDSWMAEEQAKFLSSYKVALCLENSIEPFYFTEKFINAVRAGCVPIYHAHSTVKNGILRGASWIDPADHAYDPERTIRAALGAPLARYQSTNAQWLERAEVRATHFDGVWEKLAGIFANKLAARQRKRAQSVH
jgi:Glycosyltransferase family 10 (fucosyltransferase) C-term